MKLTIILFALSVVLMAAKCTPGSSINSADPAWCKTSYTAKIYGAEAKPLCESDARCYWKVLPDGKEVCKAAV